MSRITSFLWEIVPKEEDASALYTLTLIFVVFRFPMWLTILFPPAYIIGYRIEGMIFERVAVGEPDDDGKYPVRIENTLIRLATTLVLYVPLLLTMYYYG